VSLERASALAKKLADIDGVNVNTTDAMMSVSKFKWRIKQHDTLR
jgi:hypothetical protein